MKEDFLRVDGRRIHYVEWGDPKAPTVLLLHGQSGFWHDWSQIAPPLADRYHVIAIDHPGFGDSDWDPSGKAYLVGGFAQDMAQVVDDLGLTRFAMVGHSFGGRISLAYACAHPQQVRAVVLADSSPDVDPAGSLVARRYLASIPAFFDQFDEAMRFFRAHYPNLEPAQLRERLELYLSFGAQGDWRVKRDPAIGARYQQYLDGSAEAPAADWSTLRDVGCPLLLLRGVDSDLVTGAIAAQMLAVNSTMQIVEIPGAGHLIATEQPTRTLAALRHFLDRLPA
jgi:pimeloyl-ACP methyl ester carboxylesterase